MDSAGKIVYAKNTEILTANVSNLGADGTPLCFHDGSKLTF
jgi:hypothetical protein